MTLTIDSLSSPPIASISPVPLLRSAAVSHADREVALGNLVRVRRGVLASSVLWRDLKPWERYAARVHAVTMTHPGAVLCLESAAVILGLPVLGEPREVHVLDAPVATARLNGGIRRHTTAGDRAIIDMGGILLTSASDTTIDLARSRHQAVGLSVADAALRTDSNLSVEVLVAHNECRISSRGRRHARWALHRATALAETTLESISRAAIEWLGFEAPELQHVFRTGPLTDRTDMWWPERRVVGEADGDIKYDGSLQDPAAAIRNEKARDARLRRHASGIAHWGWADVAQVDPLRDALRHAGLRATTPESSAELYSLGQLLRQPRSVGAETAVGRRH